MVRSSDCPSAAIRHFRRRPEKHLPEFDIPVLPRGYWAKLQAGKPTTKIARPPRAPGMDDEVVIGGGNRYWFGQLTNEEILSPLPDPRNLHAGAGDAAVKGCIRVRTTSALQLNLDALNESLECILDRSCADTYRLSKRRNSGGFVRCRRGRLVMWLPPKDDQVEVAAQNIEHKSHFWRQEMERSPSFVKVFEIFEVLPNQIESKFESASLGGLTREHLLYSGLIFKQNCRCIGDCFQPVAKSEEQAELPPEQVALVGLSIVSDFRCGSQVSRKRRKKRNGRSKRWLKILEGVIDCVWRRHPLRLHMHSAVVEMICRATGSDDGAGEAAGDGVQFQRPFTAEVEYRDITSEGLLRQSSFRGYSGANKLQCSFLSAAQSIESIGPMLHHLGALPY
jgi:hypothetical protein